jgi:hypothetical protein
MRIHYQLYFGSHHNAQRLRNVSGEGLAAFYCPDLPTFRPSDLRPSDFPTFRPLSVSVLPSAYLKLSLNAFVSLRHKSDEETSSAEPMMRGSRTPEISWLQSNTYCTLPYSTSKVL